MKELKEIVLIGAGNVATHLGIALIKSGRKVVQIYSRSIESAKTVSEKLNSEFVCELDKIKKDADLYIISVADKAIEELTKVLRIGDKLVVHTSGSVTMEVLKPVSKNYGVFYPFQTFSKTRDLNFKSVPVCLEANNSNILESLSKLALSITDNVHELNSDKRKKLHLAGVFASNFPNFMYSVTQTILEENNIDFEIAKPLILETAQKIQTLQPSKAQTGPAVRRDKKIIDSHLDLLEKYPEFRNLYKMISNEIDKQRERVK